MNKITKEDLKIRYLQIFELLKNSGYKFEKGRRNEFVFEFIKATERQRLPLDGLVLIVFQEQYKVNRFPVHRQRLISWLQKGPYKQPQYLLFKTQNDGVTSR